MAGNEYVDEFVFCKAKMEAKMIETEWLGRLAWLQIDLTAYYSFLFRLGNILKCETSILMRFGRNVDFKKIFLQ